MADQTQRLAIIVTAQDRATAILRGLNNELTRMAKGSAPWAQITRGTGTLAAGLGRVGIIAATTTAAGLTAAAKTAMDFQDAFSGVRKTVEGTPAQLDAIYAGLRQLAMRVPVKFTDLADLATEAGALGVATPDIVRFTEVVSRVAAAGQGLNVQDITDAFGKLGNILHVSGPDYERLGSTLVDLGNNAASTEGEIVDVARRFAAAGSQAKLSAAEVMGWSSAISSLGVLPEAAGSSLSRLFNNMTRFAAMGDGKLKSWAATAHMSFADFTKMVHDDANGAMLTFLDNLGKLDRFKAAEVLREGGIINVRDINAVLLMAQNIKEVRRELGLANNAWAQNTALAEASDKRFGTLKAKVTEFKNAILDAAASIGEGMLPAIGRAVDKLRAFLALPETQQGLKQLGRDVGDAIDRINWQKVLDGAKTFAGLARDILTVISKIPPEITAAVGAFYGVNKLSGGLIGKGLGDIVSGAIRIGLNNFFERGSTPGNALWVRMAPGLGGPGGEPTPGPGGKPGTNEPSGKGGKPGSEEPSGKGGPSIPTAGAAIGIDIATMEQLAEDKRRQLFGYTTGDGKLDYRHQRYTGPGYTGPEGMGPGYRPDMTPSTSPVVAKLDIIHSDLVAQRGVLEKSTDPAALAAAAASIAADVEKGAGNVSTTKALIDELRNKAKGTSDPALAKAYNDAADRIARKLPGREWIAAQKADAQKIAQSNKSVAEKVRELHTIQERLIAHGDTAAANIVGALLNNVVPAIERINIQTTVNNITGGTGITRPNRQPGRGGAKDAPYTPQPAAPDRNGRGGFAYPTFKPGVRLDTSQIDDRRPGRAGGGEVMAGMRYTVGENGPEEFVPRTSGRIMSSARAFALSLTVPVALNVRVSTTHRDNSIAKARHTRLGPTAAEVGAR